MSEKPPFDPVKASFYLVASILWAQCLAVIAMGIACVTWALPEIVSGKFECDKGGRLTELLTGALAAALAFAGGRARKDDDK